MILLIFSWMQYAVYVGAAIILYYLVLAWLYRKDILLRIRSKNVRHSLKQGSDTNKTYQDGDYKNTKLSGGLNHVAYDLLFEVQSYLSAIGNDVAKEFIMEDLGLIIKKYAVLKTSNLKETINNVISVSCENGCSVLLSESEIRGLWEDSEQS